MSLSPTKFADHASLMDWWCDHFREVASRVEDTLLNAQGKPLSGRRDRPFFDRTLHACLFGAPGLPASLAELKGVLAAHQAADGFEPTRLDRFTNDLDPLELIVRAYDHWNATRWPGRSGRETYARVVTAVFLFKELERLGLRAWDDGEALAAERITELQRLLDRLNAVAAPFVLVRHASWLIQTAQSPLTPHLEPHFRLTAQIDAGLSDVQRLQAHSAGAAMTSGHLRSQWRYAMWNARKAPDDIEMLAFLRNSNAMDYALIVQDLVPLLEAHGRALAGGKGENAVEIGDAILQGLSADPEIFLTRLDLVGPYTMVEDVFVTDVGGRPELAPFGARHRNLLTTYCALVSQLAPALRVHAEQLEPAGVPYSPFGVVYGFSVDILSNIAMARLAVQLDRGLSFEDTFGCRGRLDEKRARADDWARLPMRPGERSHFEHSGEFALTAYRRLLSALDARCEAGDRSNASSHRKARVVVSASTLDNAGDGSRASAVSGQEYVLTTDAALATAVGGVVWPKGELARDRREGAFLASAEVDGHLCGLSKLMLTLSVAQGHDVRVGHVPKAVADRLALTVSDVVEMV